MKHLLHLLLFASLCGCENTSAVKTGLEGNPLPSFTLLLPDSITYFHSSSIPSKQATTLFYYSPHCPYCKVQMEEIIENIQKVKNMQIFVITSSPFQEMKKFVSNYKLGEYSNIIAGADIDHFFETYFSLSNVPFTAVYGKDKRLKEAFVGKIGIKAIKNASEIE